MFAAVPMLCAGIGLGLLISPTSAPASPVGADVGAEAPNDVDVGFATDMSFHHQQALAMSQRVLGSDTSGAVQAAAAEILQTQAYEMGLLQGWLREWGESTAPPDMTTGEVMSWMDHARPADEMPGYATDEQMSELAALAGSAKGRMFLELMRAHHVGGIHMAAHAAEHAATEKIRTAAATMVEVQTYDIAVFDELLASDDT